LVTTGIDRCRLVIDPLLALLENSLQTRIAQLSGDQVEWEFAGQFGCPTAAEILLRPLETVALKWYSSDLADA